MKLAAAVKGAWVLVLVIGSVASAAAAPAHHVLTITGTTFRLDNSPFPYTGITFFKAVYNPTFTRSSEVRREWIRKFQRYGINVLRIWAQWDNRRGYADTCNECSFYFPDGRLRQNHIDKLKAILTDADDLGVVVELTLFAQESWHDQIRLGPQASALALTALTRELLPYRNVTFQIWNEFSERTLDHLKTIKVVDPKRLVCSSPGGEGVLGTGEENRALDYLTPHTSRQKAGRNWEIAPLEIAYLLTRYAKPVVDDEPARNGTSKYGGPAEQPVPFDQILQIYQVWRLGGYINYHHDMFQTGYGSPAVPPSGIPDPEFSPYHKQVLEFIAHRDRYRPAVN